MIQDLRIMKYKLGIILFIILYSLFLIPRVSAQMEPEFMVTWKANNYVPSDYQGKILPISGTAVDVNFEIIENGKFADLSKTEIFLYANDNLIKSGKGIKSLNFVADRTAGTSQLVEIIIPNYQPKKGESIRLEKSINIPLVKPEAVIDSPYPNNKINIGLNNFRSLLYFFNIANPLTDISFQWEAAGQEIRGEVANPDLLSLEIQEFLSGQEFNLNLTASNRFEEIEFANQFITLKVK